MADTLTEIRALKRQIWVEKKYDRAEVWATIDRLFEQAKTDQDRQLVRDTGESVAMLSGPRVRKK